ncbi:hypothetical protein jhhlp_005039 [Lomentospora prolificans]|uniref:N-acetyltransferase domain-containing protein n=1 Tax=Lomentospora prolificans TaxID=41688 RepID=A0A2N3N868_9PEZI|nr:hypothetical protein jhhlp_005039 [Lomentospora prolificans]
MASKHAWKVNLIPWDYKSEEHVNRLYDQRVACGWRSEEVASYAKEGEKGGKVFYWIVCGLYVLSEEHPEREALLAKHLARYPKETSPIRDTADKVRLLPRTPREIDFIPIGHVALNIHPPDEDEKLGLPRSGVTWLQQLYVSYALQKGGLGVAAMANAERVATMEPYNASLMVLDTLVKEVQTSEAIRKAMYDDRGLPFPLVSNEEWYLGLGYDVHARTTEGYVYKHPGGSIVLEVVFLKKILR